MDVFGSVQCIGCVGAKVVGLSPQLSSGLFPCCHGRQVTVAHLISLFDKSCRLVLAWPDPTVHAVGGGDTQGHCVHGLGLEGIACSVAFKVSVCQYGLW